MMLSSQDKTSKWRQDDVISRRKLLSPSEWITQSVWPVPDW